LCQADLGGKRRWTTEQRKTEKEMDRRRQAQYLQLNVEDAENRAEWRRRTRVADPSPEDPQPEGERGLNSASPTVINVCIGPSCLFLCKSCSMKGHPRTSKSVYSKATIGCE